MVGNLTADPQLRVTKSGMSVASVTVASTSKVFDKQAGRLADGETVFLRGSVFGAMAENVADDLRKGDRVIAQGKLKQGSYEKDGVKVTTYELVVDEIGPSMRFSRASIARKGASASVAVSPDGGLQAPF